MTNQANPAALAEVKKVFEDNIAAMIEAQAKAQGWVLAWDNGLAVKFDAEGKPFACGVVHAEVVMTESQYLNEEAHAYMPNVLNGLNEPAKLVRHYAALARAIEQSKVHLKQIEEAA